MLVFNLDITTNLMVVAYHFDVGFSVVKFQMKWQAKTHNKSFVDIYRVSLIILNTLILNKRDTFQEKNLIFKSNSDILHKYLNINHIANGQRNVRPISATNNVSEITMAFIQYFYVAQLLSRTQVKCGKIVTS